MLRGARVAIRNGRDTAFWTSRWIDSGDRLCDLFTGDALLYPDACVADFITPTGAWDLTKLNQVLPSDVISTIIGMTPPQADKGEDLWVWGAEQTGKLSIESAYKIVCDLAENQLLDPWKAVWGWKGPNRVRFFFWLVSHYKLLTNLGRVRRHLSTDASCGFCHHHEESVLHILRDCTVAVEVWRQLRDFNEDGAEWNQDLRTWICHFLNSEHGALFGMTCWLLWKARNSRIFSGTTSTPLSIVIQSLHWARNVKAALARNDLVGEESDGSVEATGGRTAAGGLLRNSHGRCLLAFTMNLGRCSITRAEIRGAIEGLNCMWDAGFRKVILQLDSKVAISLLTNITDSSHQHGLEILQFKELCQREWLVEVKHTYREGNHAADFLASIGYGYPFRSHIVSSSDSSLVYFLRYDCMGTTEHRSILIND
ncbi:Putative ribonuclease H protein At1g65750 [Linum perenne]